MVQIFAIATILLHFSCKYLQFLGLIEVSIFCLPDESQMFDQKLYVVLLESEIVHFHYSLYNDMKTSFNKSKQVSTRLDVGSVCCVRRSIQMERVFFSKLKVCTECPVRDVSIRDSPFQQGS